MSFNEPETICVSRVQVKRRRPPAAVSDSTDFYFALTLKRLQPHAYPMSTRQHSEALRQSRVPDRVPRDRVFAALDFTPPDVVPLRIYAAAGGLHEHGRKLVDLIKACGHDFGDFSALQTPDPPTPGDVDDNGRYHAFKTDEWGATWEYRIFGIWGHPAKYPLDAPADVEAYSTPAPPPASGRDFEEEKARIDVEKAQYFTIGRGGSLFEKLHSLRRFEDVLMDIATDAPHINCLADKLVDYTAAQVRRSLALDVDGISFGDDFGTQSALLLAPDTWRRFFKPRYQVLFAPIKSAGKKILFHCCGMIEPLLSDFKDLGVDVLWPQLPAFDMSDLAKRSRDLKLALELHPDRGDLMQSGSPADIHHYVHRMLDTFRTRAGGSWLYIEIDPGFPWPNVEALFKTAMKLRES